MTTAQESEFRALYEKALAAGIAAGEAAIPTPMIVGTPTTFFGSDVDLSQKTYYVPDGPCGFAWVNIRPGTSSFARWLVKNGVARKAYGGGVSISVRRFGQSLIRKEAFAYAAARVFSEAGITAYGQSRID